MDQKIILLVVDSTQFAEAVRHLEVYWLVVSEAPPRGRAA
jgi:hypothetical protein